MDKLQKNNKGFTIIEVLIVLAIAALILLIIFLAVPSLEVNSRNTARKQDIARLGGAITEFVNHNNGAPPGYINGAWDNTLVQPRTDAQTILNLAGTLGGYHLTLNNPITTSGITNGLSLVTGTPGLPAPLSASVGDQIQIVSGGVCNGAGATSVGATQHNIAIQYTLEILYSSQSGVYCQQVE